MIKTCSFFIAYILYLAAYSQIDWHDFVVVEVVDYQPQEQGNFPVSCNFENKIEESFFSRRQQLQKWSVHECFFKNDSIVR